MESIKITDSAAAAARRARFGRLPERVRFEDMVEVAPVEGKDLTDTYAADKSFISYSCLALDLGL
ncbi:hypothetical protein [Actinacidiphila sp. bgisy144]|uniref:hypothetical protein n=1 Tax=Actinacidiphila sp. bgisy144 TaxID=3413791 RepID=UPI003EBD605A